MLTGLDHIIIGVNDLERAAKIFNDDLGLTVSGGGVHPTGGTANRIIVIGDTYLELITVRDSSEAQPSMLERLAKGEGYLNFVLGSNDIEADSRAMTARGIHLIGPKAGELRSAEGRSRGWTRLDVGQADLAQHYPFIIQHDSTGEERRFRLAGWRTPPAHMLGATKVLSTTIVVENLAEAAERFQRIYGLEPSIQYGGDVDGWDAVLVSFSLDGSLQSFELVAPLPTGIDPLDESAHLPEPGALAEYLQQFGESLCRMTLEVKDLAAARSYLDSHYVTYTYRDEPRPVLWIHPVHTCGAALTLYEQEF